ncbi:hypothetical protein V8C34DRAFT_283642 [Trichoderma compactum]
MYEYCRSGPAPAMPLVALNEGWISIRPAGFSLSQRLNTFAFPPRLVRAELIQRRWAGLEAQSALRDWRWRFCRSTLLNDPEPRRLSGLRAIARTWTWRSRRYANALAF